MQFFFEVLIGGLLSGVMYSLVALGFVLIYKASGVFNFAQGSMVFFAALTFVGLLEKGLGFWLALPATLAVMIVLGLVIERIVLRPLINQPQITLFMATIGLSFFIEGLAQLMWGANVRGLELGIQDEPLQWVSDVAGVNVSKFDLVAAGIAAVLVSTLAIFFSRTRIGRALRAGQLLQREVTALLGRFTDVEGTIDITTLHRTRQRTCTPLATEGFFGRIWAGSRRKHTLPPA